MAHRNPNDERQDVKERPILFNGSMVRAMLNGRKRQTRWIIKPQPDQFGFWRYNSTAKCDDCGDHYRRAPKRCKCGCTLFKTVEYPIQKCLSECPCGQAGDRLWVRETFLPKASGTIYRADFSGFDAAGISGMYGGWKPSILMPRKASRITLEITAVRVERLQAISKADVLAEGTTGSVWLENGSIEECHACYKQLWESINGKGSWSANPWIWVIEFKRVTP